MDFIYNCQGGGCACQLLGRVRVGYGVCVYVELGVCGSKYTQNNSILVELLLLNKRRDLKVHVKKPVCKVTVRWG